MPAQQTTRAAARRREPPISSLGRVEHISDILLTAANSPYGIPRGNGYLPTDRYMRGLDLRFAGRLTNPATNLPAAILADAPYSLIESIRVSGYHKFRRQPEQFINLRGADLYALNRHYLGIAPLSLPATPLALTAAATNDIMFSLYLPFTPLGLSHPLAMVKYLLDAPNYEGLEFKIQFADHLSVFSGQTSPITYSAYGSDTGSPMVSVSGDFALGGPVQFKNLVTARVHRFFSEVSAGDIVSGGANKKLFDLPTGHRLRAVLLKTGTKATTTSAGNNAFATLTDPIENVKIDLGLNRSIRYYRSVYEAKEEIRRAYKTAPIAGYTLIDFCRNGTLSEALKTGGLVAGASTDIDLTLNADITAQASGAAVAIYEELRHRMERPSL